MKSDLLLDFEPIEFWSELSKVSQLIQKLNNEELGLN